MKRSIVIGKFYPFHAGHSLLIETARAKSDEVTVLVCDRSDQVFSGEERATWIREAFHGVTVRVMRDIGHDDNSELWARYTLEFLGYKPSIVFTSESYGDAYARFLGAKHISVDIDRRRVPISATQIREHPYKNWNFLGRAVRARLIRRVALVGAESTGTTTLSRALAEHFQTVWVPEFGRFYSEGKQPSKEKWETEEFIFIAKTQNHMEDAYAREANKILFCDTNAWATRFWHERYIGTIDPFVNELSCNRRYDLVILTGDEIPFVNDGLRDGEHIRHAMQKRFRKELSKNVTSYIEVSGTIKERLEKAVAACESLLLSDQDIFGGFPQPTSV